MLLSLLVVALLVAGCGSPKPTEQKPAAKIVLRVVTPWPQTSVEHLGLFTFLDEVTQKLGDRLEIKYLGGPEIIGSFDQFEMLSKGVFDIGHLPGNYAKSFLPIAETLHLSRIKPWEERENGVYDLLRSEFEKKMNLVYLGKHASDGYLYQLYTNFPVTTIEDFRGKSIRTAPVYVPFLKELGAGAVSMAPGDIYTAMERKTVDGFGWPTLGVLGYGWAEVTKYRIDPGFYPVGIGLFFNLDTWKNLPEDIRKELETIAKNSERATYDKLKQLVEEETRGIQAKGMTVIKLSDAEAKKFTTLAFDAGWKDVIDKDPVNGQKLKDLTTPK